MQHQSQPGRGGWLEKRAMHRFPASLCHVSTHGFASLLPGRYRMFLNLYPQPKLAEMSHQAQKPSLGGSHMCVCMDTHAEHNCPALAAHGNQAKEGAASPCSSCPCSAFSIVLCLVTPDGKRELCCPGWGPGLGTELVSSKGMWLTQVRKPP